MKATLILMTALSLSACGTTFGVGVEAPVGDNAKVGVSTNTKGETEVDLTVVLD